MHATSPPANTCVITLSLCQILMERITHYAQQKSTTPDAILLESIEAYLTQYPLPKSPLLEHGDDGAR